MSSNRFTNADLDRFAAELNRDGITIIRGLLDRELIDRWAAAFTALFRSRQGRPGGWRRASRPGTT